MIDQIFHFRDPWILLLLSVVPLLVWLRLRRGQTWGALTYSTLSAVRDRPWKTALARHGAFICRLLALALLICAWARPQFGTVSETQSTEGIDIQLVLDVSGSMAAEDFKPRNRLTVAKQVVQEFISAREGDRLGLVIFAGSALTKAPLTSDRRMLADLVESVQLYALPDGTAIGLALANAAARLQHSPAESKVVVLVTDGVNNRGAIDPDSAAAVCQGLGIRVYTIGVGTAGTVRVPMQFRSASGETEIRPVMMDVEVDEELLQSVAERTGGRFYKATDSETLREVFAEIDELEKTPLETQRHVVYREMFRWPAGAALALLLLPLIPAFLGIFYDP